jgi:hypothetical protein
MNSDHERLRVAGRHRVDPDAHLAPELVELQTDLREQSLHARIVRRQTQKLADAAPGKNCTSSVPGQMDGQALRDAYKRGAQEYANCSI